MAERGRAVAFTRANPARTVAAHAARLDEDAFGRCDHRPRPIASPGKPQYRASAYWYLTETSNDPWYSPGDCPAFTFSVPPMRKLNTPLAEAIRYLTTPFADMLPLT